MQNAISGAGACAPSAGAYPGQSNSVDPRMQVGFSGPTRILTLDGMVPVDCLRSGDRIVTRDRGAVRLRLVVSQVHRAATPVVLMPRALGHSRPERPFCIGAQQPILIRDWRARALFGRSAVLVSATRLIDGAHVRHDDVHIRLRLFQMLFDRPHIIYAEGIECAAGPILSDQPRGAHAISDAPVT